MKLMQNNTLKTAHYITKAFFLIIFFSIFVKAKSQNIEGYMVDSNYILHEFKGSNYNNVGIPLSINIINLFKLTDQLYFITTDAKSFYQNDTCLFLETFEVYSLNNRENKFKMEYRHFFLKDKCNKPYHEFDNINLDSDNYSSENFEWTDYASILHLKSIAYNKMSFFDKSVYYSDLNNIYNQKGELLEKISGIGDFIVNQTFSENGKFLTVVYGELLHKEDIYTNTQLKTKIFVYNTESQELICSLNLVNVAYAILSNDGVSLVYLKIINNKEYLFDAYIYDINSKTTKYLFKCRNIALN